MTPQTRMRRTALIEQIITDTALGYRFDDSGYPRTTETIKERWEHAIDLWNSTADLIDNKRGRPLVRGRYVRTGAGTARFDGAAWFTVDTLDGLNRLLDECPAGLDDLDLQPGIVRWMADFLFVTLIPQDIFDRAAHTKGHIWDRRLRHTNRAKGRKRQAFMFEASLVTEEARQEAEFRSFLREVLRKDRKLRRDIRADRNFGDFDFSTAPPDVRIVQLADRKGFMLTPPRHAKAKRAPKYPETK